MPLMFDSSKHESGLRFGSFSGRRRYAYFESISKIFLFLRADRIKTLHPKNCVNCGTRALHEAVMCLFLRLRLPSHCHQVRWWNIENGSIRTWFWRPWDTHIKIPQTIVMALIFFFHTSTYNPANGTYSVYFFLCVVWRCYQVLRDRGLLFVKVKWEVDFDAGMSF